MRQRARARRVEGAWRPVGCHGAAPAFALAWATRECAQTGVSWGGVREYAVWGSRADSSLDRCVNG